MKIGYFVEKFPYFSLKNESEVYPLGGGMKTVPYSLAVNIAKIENDVHVFTTSVNSKSALEEKWGIAIHRYGTLLKFFKRNVSLGLLLKPNIDVNVVHAHITSEPFVLIAALRYAKRKKVPLVVTYHGDVIPAYKNIAYRVAVRFHNHVVRKVLDRANVIIVPSEHYINESIMLSKYINKIVVIPNGIDIEDFDVPYSKEECREKLELPLNENIILFVGVILPHKGPDVLLKAMPEILKKVPDAKLVFIGSGRMRGELEILSKKLNVNKHIKFAGFVKENLKPLYYRAADVFCLPSVMKTEVFPLVLLEASASGLPIVVSDLDTFKCIIEDGYNGIVTKRGDENNLADAIIYLLENEEVREKMGENAKKKVDDYSWERIAEKTEKIYEEVS